MLDIQVKIEGDKVIIEGLGKIAQELPGAITKGLTRSAKGIHGNAQDFLSGAGAKGETTGFAYADIKTRKLKISKQKWTPQSIPAGGYPVPARRKHLLGSLYWLKPGTSRTHESGKTFTVGPHEVIISDSAIYQHPIHEGTWTQTKHGPRRFLTDALTKFNQGDRIKKIMEEEIQKAKEKAKL